jgi:NAD-dependent dihydropyrimidine dehydrogenase PreA subunit
MLSVDSGKCTGCGACVDVCPPAAISVRNNVAVIDDRICSQCGSCLEVCPAGAIRVVEPVHANLRKGGNSMRGRGSFGRGYWGWGRGWGRGRGNPYPFCRFYPWLPRRWWAYDRGAYPQMASVYGPVYQPYRQW